jgi:hypothetical protein
LLLDSQYNRSSLLYWLSRGRTRATREGETKPGPKSLKRLGRETKRKLRPARRRETVSAETAAQIQ